MRKSLICLFLWTFTPATATPLPFVCELTSEETSSIKIRLTERTALSLKGELLQDEKVLGVFQSGKPKPGKAPWWSFHHNNSSSRGVSVLFKDTEIWNPYRQLPRPEEINRVLFAGLVTSIWSLNRSEKLRYFHKNYALLKAAGGFWSISSLCIGGRIEKG